jgi:hypothetical protein
MTTNDGTRKAVREYLETMVDEARRLVAEGMAPERAADLVMRQHHLALAMAKANQPSHDCDANMVAYDHRGQPGAGPLGHGYECSVCHRFLQAG